MEQEPDFRLSVNPESLKSGGPYRQQNAPPCGGAPAGTDLVSSRCGATR